MREEHKDLIEGWIQGVREWWMELEDSMESAGSSLWSFTRLVRSRPLALRWTTVILSVAFSTLIGLAFRDFVTLGSQLMLFLPAVLLSAAYGGAVAGTAASMLGAAVSIHYYFRSIPDRAAAAEVPVDQALQQGYVGLLLYFLACTMVIALTRAQAYYRAKEREFAVQLEERVQQRTADLREAHEELAGFCYSISHDLRAPMRNLVGSSTILLEESDEKFNEETRKRLLGMAASANRLSNLVDDLLGYARLSDANLRTERIDLSQVVESLCEQLQRQPWGFSRVFCKVQPSLITGGDQPLVAMAIRNMLENSFKYARPGLPLEIEFGETRRGGVLQYFLKDNGIGFDMKYAPKIFEPFQRLHRDTEYSGTGIGLANVQRIIQKHGGDISVESEPGVGTTFFFSFGGHMTEQFNSAQAEASRRVVMADEL